MEDGTVSKKTAESPFQALEEEAYHAFREWPVWLVLRERELAGHLDSGNAADPPAAARTDTPSTTAARQLAAG